MIAAFWTALLILFALTACVTPDYRLCGVPYTDAEDAAGVEHLCTEE